MPSDVPDQMLHLLRNQHFLAELSTEFLDSTLVHLIRLVCDDMTDTYIYLCVCIYIVYILQIQHAPSSEVLAQ